MLGREGRLEPNKTIAKSVGLYQDFTNFTSTRGMNASKLSSYAMRKEDYATLCNTNSSSPSTVCLNVENVMIDIYDYIA